MKILIYEPDPSGHRLTAARMLLDALREIEPGHDLTIVLASTAAAPETEEFALQLAPVAAHFELAEVAALTPGAGSARIALDKVRGLKTLLQAQRFDHVYIPYADGMMQVLGALRLNPFFSWPSSGPIEALMMRGGFAYPDSPRTRRWLNVRLLLRSGASRIHWIDPIPARQFEAGDPALARISNLMPDPNPYATPIDRHAAHEALQLAPGRYLGCVGRIDERKGIHHLLQAFVNADLQPDDRLLLAGRHTDMIRQQISAIADPHVRQRIVSLDRYIDNDELNQATCAIDLMVTPYPQFVGSVSIVARAAVAGRMSVGTDYGWMGQVIPGFELGAVVPLGDASSLTRALPSLLAQSMNWQPGPAAQEFVAFLSRENVSAHWTALLRERLARPGALVPQAWPPMRSPK